MAATSTPTRLDAARREGEGSRAARRLRRTGRVPGVLYGHGEDPVAFDVDALELRHALAASGAVLELSLGGGVEPVVVKDTQRHPVRGETMHVDFLRVRLDERIQTPVVVELVNVDAAPGVVEGGVLEQPTREITVEATPNEIPEVITFDASGLAIGATLTLAELTAPPGVLFVDDPETVIASITAPRLEVESDEEIEQETEVVGGVTADQAADAALDVPSEEGEGGSSDD